MALGISRKGREGIRSREKLNLAGLDWTGSIDTPDFPFISYNMDPSITTTVISFSNCDSMFLLRYTKYSFLPLSGA